MNKFNHQCPGGVHPVWLVELVSQAKWEMQQEDSRGFRIPSKTEPPLVLMKPVAICGCFVPSVPASSKRLPLFFVLEV